VKVKNYAVRRVRKQALDAYLPFQMDAPIASSPQDSNESRLSRRLSKVRALALMRIGDIPAHDNR
jgi:hypothetical protein